jgi:HEAT repeat protein
MNKFLKIKKITLSVLAIMLLQVAVVAQVQEDNRTLKTRIADLLVQFPATDAEDYERLMIETASLGEPGILQMAQLFSPPGQGDNSKLEYALGGLSFYVMQEENEELRLITSTAYSKAVDIVPLDEVKAFFILQLQRVGKNEAVETLGKYLASERFCGPAARALVSIKTPLAQESLLGGLSSAAGKCQYALIEALGDVRNKKAVDALANFVESNDAKAKKLVLYALANIGDPSSEDILAAAAKEADYKLNETNATSLYFLWAQRMVEAGNTKPVEKLTKKLLRKLDDEGQVHSKTVALKLLIDATGEDARRQIVKAATDDNPELRAAALKFAAPLKGEKINSQWLKELKKADAPVKADLIAFLADRNDANNYAAVSEYLNSEDPAVKLAAIRASAKPGNEKAVPKLLEIMQTANEKEVEVVKTSLLTTSSNNLPAEVANALPKVNSPAGKAALLEVLASRRATNYAEPVFALLNNEHPQVRLAAIHALQHVSTEENLPSLYTLLVSAKNDEEVALTQAAIINALGAGNTSRSATIIMQQMEQAPPDKKHMYYNILASIGTDEALNAVVNEYHQGNAVAKKAAINAMKNWKGFSAGRALLKIARSSPDSPHFDQALKAYVQQVRTSDNTDENKYLLLREAMEIANTADQKRTILNQIGASPVLPALFYAAKFLDDPEVKRQAASAVTNIVQGNENFYGEKVRNVLEKTMVTLEGQESAYLKEAIRNHLEKMPEGPGFVALFNEKDLSGWKGLVGNPLKRAEMDAKTLAKEQAKADEAMRESWKVEDGKLIFTGKGQNISTVKKYGDFEMYVDWRIEKDGDAGIYLRGTSQVQIWDTARRDAGAQVGSGGLYNNKTHESKPLKVADNPVGEWNNFHIIMKGDRVTVHLNGELVVDNVVLENFWDREQPIFPQDYIELQAHGTKVEYRDIYIRELGSEPFLLSEEEKSEGFEVLFDGTNLDKWQGNKSDYIIENGDLVIRPKKGSRGNLYTTDQYSDFIFRFEFQLTPGANNGLGIRTPLEGNAAYEGMELQILDNTADIYKDLHKYQYHGSVYGVIPAERGYLKPVGEWNYQEVVAEGPNIKITLNGHVILDGNIEEASENGTLDGKEHPGLKRETGYIGFLGHGSVVKFRNIRVKQLKERI